MSDDPQPPPSSQSEPEVAPAVASQWIIAGIISASARFIPIPFLDEIVQNRCRRYAVKTAIESHPVELQLSSLEPYYSNSSGCFTGCLGMTLKLPIKLLLFPLRKIIALVTSVRGVPLEIMRVYLLGRTLDRYLSNGRLGQSENSLRIDDKAYAARMGSAFEQSFSRMDMHVVLAAMKDATGGFTELGAAAVVGFKSVFDRSNKSARAFVAEPEVKAEVFRIQASFSQAEMLALFEKFDRRFDDSLQGDSLEQASQSRNSRGT